MYWQLSMKSVQEYKQTVEVAYLGWVAVGTWLRSYEKVIMFMHMVCRLTLATKSPHYETQLAP